MPKPKNDSDEEFKKYLTQEYDRLLDENNKKPKHKRRTKEQISKQAYAIAMSVMDKQKKSNFKESLMFFEDDNADLPVSLMIMDTDIPDVDLEELNDNDDNEGNDLDNDLDDYNPDLDDF